MWIANCMVTLWQLGILELLCLELMLPSFFIPQASESYFTPCSLPCLWIMIFFTHFSVEKQTIFLFTTLIIIITTVHSEAIIMPPCFGHAWIFQSSMVLHLTIMGKISVSHKHCFCCLNVPTKGTEDPLFQHALIGTLMTFHLIKT